MNRETTCFQFEIQVSRRCCQIRWYQLFSSSSLLSTTSQPVQVDVMSASGVLPVGPVFGGGNSIVAGLTRTESVRYRWPCSYLVTFRFLKVGNTYAFKYGRSRARSGHLAVLPSSISRNQKSLDLNVTRLWISTRSAFLRSHFKGWRLAGERDQDVRL